MAFSSTRAMIGGGGSASSPLKAIFGYGADSGNLSMTNLVSTSGVVAAETTGVGTARNWLAAAEYGV